MFGKEVYTMQAGRRGGGEIAFLRHLLAQRTAQLMTAKNRIAELERQLLRQQINIAYEDHIRESKFSAMIHKGMQIKK